MSAPEAAQKEREEVRPYRGRAADRGSLPTDPELAKSELTAEERARRGSRPNSRRWRGLGRLDDKVDDLARRLEGARQVRQRAEQRAQAAPDADARSLSDWMGGGEKGRRPEATVYERERERDAAQLTIEALERRLDETLEERLGYVARHRSRLIADARKDIETVRARLRAQVRELPALRAELLDAREVLAWTATYPGQVEQFGYPTALALGLRAPVERTLETKALVQFDRIVAALEADIEALAERHHVQVLQALGTAAAAHARTRSDVDRGGGVQELPAAGARPGRPARRGRTRSGQARRGTPRMTELAVDPGPPWAAHLELRLHEQASQVVLDDEDAGSGGL